MQISRTSLILGTLTSQSTNSKKNSSNQLSEKSDAYTLDLSDAAKSIMQISANPIDKISASNAMPKLGNELTQQISDTQNQLKRVLLSRGIDPNADYDFSVNDQGRIVLNTDSPDKQAIEDAINNDQSLSNNIKKTLNDSQMKALGDVQQKYMAVLEDSEDKDDEEKKKLIQEQIKAAQTQISEISNNFSMNGGTMSVASLDFSAGLLA